jgi:hypothetical protein
MAEYLVFSALLQFSHIFFGFPTFSAWVLISRNAHLVHHSFTIYCIVCFLKKNHSGRYNSILPEHENCLEPDLGDLASVG